MASAIHAITVKLPKVFKKTNWGISATVGTKKQFNKRTYFTYSRELCHVVDHVPKSVTAEEAVKCVKSSKLNLPTPYHIFCS